MNVLGVNAFNHEPSACLIAHGCVAAAVEQEKISRQKDTHGFPAEAISECLALARVEPADVDLVAISRRHLLEVQSHAWHMLRYFPQSLNLLRADTAALSKASKRSRYLEMRPRLRSLLRRNVPIAEFSHHQSHAAAVFFQSQFEDALVLVADGIAEYDTCWLGHLRKGSLRELARVPFPHSFGMIYAAFTDLLGFQSFKDEWKVMGMAAYGSPRFYEQLSGMISVGSDFAVRINPRYFSFPTHGRRQWFGPAFPFLRLKRAPHEEITQEHYDLACSMQSVFEDRMLALVRSIMTSYPLSKNLCLSGGVFLNCLFNGRLNQTNLFDNIYVDCNPGDAGSAMGAALLGLGNGSGLKPLEHSNHLGREYTADEIRSALQQNAVKFKELQSVEELACLLDQGKVLGLAHGRSEYGPRALGARSILADPRLAHMKDKINSQVKYREHFRPFAPSVLESEQHHWFPGKAFSPYMSFAVPALVEKAALVPAVVHGDGTSRIQSVRKETNPFYHELISGFSKLSGVPMLLNTSFNIRGEPIVYAPSDAIQTFRRAALDALVMPPFLALR
jgi:carbamoyltransferase